jgi:ZipA-like protein with FtsZ-binding domain
VSELQIALLLIAGAVLTGLYLAGKWQERRLLRRLGEQLGSGVGDPLLDDPEAGQARSPQPRAGTPRQRIEPQLRAEPIDPASQAADEAPVEQEPPVQTARRSDWIEDPMLDCVLELRCARPVDGVSFIDAAVPLMSSQWPMPVSFVVWDARAQQWVHPDRFGYYTDALAAIQLASRRNLLTEDQIDRFVSSVRQMAATLDADCDPPDVVRVAANARELDRLCARFDVRIGLTLESASGGWTEARVAAAAAQVGLEPLADLRWAPEHGAGPAPLVLTMPAPASDRITLELDVPTIGAGEGAVQQLFGLSNQLAAQLNARIVDDNARPIDSQSVAAIEAQLTMLYEQMRSAGIDPGGERARRLYV